MYKEGIPFFKLDGLLLIMDFKILNQLNVTC